jgi:hypothetical protein
MEFKDAKNKIKEEYAKHRITCIDESDKELLLKMGEKVQLKVCEDDIIQYAKFEDIRLDYQIEPNECSICSTNYRENIVIPLASIRSRAGRLREDKVVFGEISEDQKYAVISQPSDMFFDVFRFNPDFIYASFRLPMFFPAEPPVETVDIRSKYYRPMTIKVYNLNEHRIQDSISTSTQIIENCLFQLAYLKEAPYWLAEEWPIKRTIFTRGFEFNERFEGWNLPLKGNYISDVIKFYQFAVSTDIPELKYLSFYQVLEYFYIPVSNEKLYEKLSNKLKEPRFKYTPSYLDQIILEVDDHKKITDEAEMLKNVLEKFIGDKELIKYISSYEAHLKSQIYSKKHNVFGTDVEVQLKTGHVCGNLAKQIKETRNAIVHSSDRLEQKNRHVPFSKTTKSIMQDIPLMKFIAEKVIIATSIVT